MRVQCWALIGSECTDKEHIHTGRALEKWFSLMGPGRKGYLYPWECGQGIWGARCGCEQLARMGLLEGASSSYSGSREPEEEKLYKIRQGLVTVVVINSYWSGEWGS